MSELQVPGGIIEKYLKQNVVLYLEMKIYVQIFIKQPAESLFLASEDRALVDSYEDMSF